MEREKQGKVNDKAGGDAFQYSLGGWGEGGEHWGPYVLAAVVGREQDMQKKPVPLLWAVLGSGMTSS